MSFFITGLSGVGKSYLAKKIENVLDFDLMNFGDLIEQHPTDNKNIDKIRAIVCSKIGQYPRNDFLLIDGHTVLESLGEILISLSAEDLEKMNTSKILLINARPKVIAHRRKNDLIIRPDRNCSIKDKHLKIFQQRQNEIILGISSKLSIPTKIIHNNEELNPKELELITNFLTKT